MSPAKLATRFPEHELRLIVSAELNPHSIRVGCERTIQETLLTSRWIIAFLTTCVLAIPGGAQRTAAPKPRVIRQRPISQNRTPKRLLPDTSRDVVVLAPQACSPDVPQQIVDYLELTPKQIGPFGHN